MPFSACMKAKQEMKEWTIPFMCLCVMAGGGRRETQYIFKPLGSLAPSGLNDPTVYTENDSKSFDCDFDFKKKRK